MGCRSRRVGGRAARGRKIRVAAMNAPAWRLDASDKLCELAGVFAAHAAECDRRGRIPADALDAAAAAGLLALTVPRKLGGGGAGVYETVAIARRLASGDPSATLILAMTWIQHATLAHENRWPQPLYHEVVRDAVSGRGLINALRVEPELGTPFRGGLPRTVARATPDGWRISGRKIYSTGASVLRWLVVFARTDEERPRLGQFLVPANGDGITIEETWDHLGMRATGSHDVIFDAAPVPLAHAVDLRSPQEWVGPSSVQSAWNAAVISAVYLGVADAARDWLVRFLRSRAPTGLGRPLATLERMQLGLGAIEADIRSASMLLDALAAKVDEAPQRLDPAEPGIVKHVVTESAIRAVQSAVALSGNPGLSRSEPLERHLRDVLCARVHTPQNDSVLKAAGLAALERTAPDEHRA